MVSQVCWRQHQHFHDNWSKAKQQKYPGRVDKTPSDTWYHEEANLREQGGKCDELWSLAENQKSNREKAVSPDTDWAE